jgi:glycosyltransferase involved in cell wall biosynthesis
VFLLEELGVNWRMYRSARAFSPDVIHAHDVNTLAPAWLAARMAGARLVYDAHEISADREGYDGRIWLVKLVERWLGNRAQGRITTTQARADWFMSAYHYPEVTVLQNRPVRNIADGSNLIRERFDIPADQPLVLYQGGLQWGRGLSNLLEAMRGLPRGHLVFVGDGVQRAALEQAAADMADRVHFVGQVPLAELPAWTASADIGVQTLRNTCLNHYTTDSNKLFEYVMGGLPVVASDFPEIRTVVTADDLGVLVDPDDVESIRGALGRLLDDEPYRQRLADNARRAREHLDWTSQAPKLLDLYRAVVS